MYRIKQPRKDTTIFSDRPCKNTGLDEILQLRVSGDSLPKSPPCDSDFLVDNSDFLNKYDPNEIVGPGSNYEDLINELYPTIINSNLNAQKSRILFYFELEKWFDIVDELQREGSGVSDKDYNVFLRTYTTEAEKLPISYKLQVYPISHSNGGVDFGGGFEQGTGRESDQSTQGSSWIFRSIVNEDRWDIPGVDFVTEHPDDSSKEVSGEQKFDFEDPDVYMSIKNVFDYWKEFGNSGALLKFDDEVEELKSDSFRPPSNLTDPATLYFFGSLTHTIYAPEILLASDEHEWDTRNGSMISYDESLKVSIKNLKEVYFTGETSRFRVRVEERFPPKKFIERGNYVENKKIDKFLPEGSLQYSIKDAVVDKTIVPFSKYSQLSFDPDGYYFDVDFSNFYPERVYEIRFKYVDPLDDFTDIYENDHKFKVEK